MDILVISLYKQLFFPTPLGPGIYEPEIGSGFPFIYPDSPMIGDNVRLECWASGTSSPEPLIYSWEKIEFVNGDKVVVPMPPQAIFSDHNR